MNEAVPVKVEHMIGALEKAIERFRNTLVKDPKRAEKVYRRAKKQFYALVPHDVAAPNGLTP